MSKSILVIDTPKSCVKCPLIKQINTFIHQGYNCSRNDKKIEHILEKPDWCPLLDLPEKKNKQQLLHILTVGITVLMLALTKFERGELG